MNAKKTPLQQVNEEHGGKAKLVDKILGIIELDGKDADEVKASLLAASNKKLLRIVKVRDKIKAKYGTPAKVVDAISAAFGRAKDSDYVKKLGTFGSARLLDIAEAVARRVRGERPHAAPVIHTGDEAKPAKKAAAKPAKAEKAAKPAKAEKAAKPAADKAEKPAKAAKAPKEKK